MSYLLTFYSIVFLLYSLIRIFQSHRNLYKYDLTQCCFLKYTFIRVQLSPYLTIKTIIYLKVIMDVGLPSLIQQHIAKLLQQQEIITYLNLGWNFIGDKSLILILHHLQKQENIKTIDLSRNGITDQGIKSLSKTKWRLLQHLELWSNSITSKGVGSLLNANWQYLIRLQLGCNPLGAIGCKILSQGEWNDLKQLGLSKTEMMDEGVKHIVKSKMPRLSKFRVGNNKLTDQACLILNKGDYSNLTQLDLSQNDLNQLSIFRLATMNCTKLQICWISSSKTRANSLQQLRFNLQLIRSKFNSMTQFYL